MGPSRLTAKVNAKKPGLFSDIHNLERRLSVQKGGRGKGFAIDLLLSDPLQSLCCEGYPYKFSDSIRDQLLGIQPAKQDFHTLKVRKNDPSPFHGIVKQTEEGVRMKKGLDLTQGIPSLHGAIPTKNDGSFKQPFEQGSMQVFFNAPPEYPFIDLLIHPEGQP
jgi:hypothetical protein